MGTSKTILLSGVYLMLGYYSISFTRIEENNFSESLEVSSALQSEQLAKTGISLALLELGNDSLKTSIALNDVSVMGGVVSITANRPVSFPLTQTQIITMGQYNGEQISMTAVCEHTGGRWKVLRVYSNIIS